MKSKKEWFLPKELAGVGGLPPHPSNVTRKAKKQGWEKREAKGIQGGGFEYHYSSLPEKVQRELGFNTPKLHLSKNDNNKKELEKLDLATLELAIETLEEALEETNREISASKKATLVLAIYDLLLQESGNKDPVLKLIKSIA